MDSWKILPSLTPDIEPLNLYIDICDGDVTNARMLMKLVNICKIHKTPDCWIAIAHGDWNDLLRIKYQTARDSLDRLEKRGFIERARDDTRGTTLIRVRWETLDRCIEGLPNVKEWSVGEQQGIGEQQPATKPVAEPKTTTPVGNRQPAPIDSKLDNIYKTNYLSSKREDKRGVGEKEGRNTSTPLTKKPVRPLKGGRKLVEPTAIPLAGKVDDTPLDDDVVEQDLDGKPQAKPVTELESLLYVTLGENRHLERKPKSARLSDKAQALLRTKVVLNGETYLSPVQMWESDPDFKPWALERLAYFSQGPLHDKTNWADAELHAVRLIRKYRNHGTGFYEFKAQKEQERAAYTPTGYPAWIFGEEKPADMSELPGMSMTDEEAEAFWAADKEDN